MTENEHITVVRGGRAVWGIAGGSGLAIDMFSGVAAPLGTEGVHHIRGWLMPWQRRKKRALLAAYALAGPPPTPPKPTIRPIMAQVMLGMHKRLFNQLNDQFKMPGLRETVTVTREGNTTTELHTWDLDEG